MVSHKVETFPKGASKSGVIFKKVGQKVTHLFQTVKYSDQKSESQSGALFKKERHKVASFFKKGDESDAPVDRGIPVGAAKKLPRGGTTYCCEYQLLAVDFTKCR